MNVEDLRLNQSGLRRYACEEAWALHAVTKIRKLRGPAHPARDRGKLFHALVEFALREFAETGKPYTFEGFCGRERAREVFSTLYDAEGTDCSEETAHELLAAIRWQVADWNLEQWEVVHRDGGPLIEVDLRAPLIPGVQLQAILDVVLRHVPTGLIWFTDWKSTADAINTTDSPPYVEHNYQLAIGREVLKHAGIVPDVCALRKLRSTAPRVPGLTGRKKVMRNLSKLACDWPTFRQALIDNDEDPDAKTFDKARASLQCSVFNRWIVDITSDEAHALMRRDLERVGARMLAISRGEVKPIRSINHPFGKMKTGCAACDKETWCRAALRRGGEYDLDLLGIHYEADEDSPLAGREKYGKIHDPSDAYVAWAAARGRTLQRDKEFSP